MLQRIRKARVSPYLVDVSLQGFSSDWLGLGHGRDGAEVLSVLDRLLSLPVSQALLF